jgi:hypothetical protein
MMEAPRPLRDRGSVHNVDAAIKSPNLPAPALKLTTLMLAAAVLVAGCGSSPRAASSPSPIATATGTSHSSPSPGGSPSPAGSPAASPVPVTGAFGVLVTPPTSDTYTVNLIGIDGKVVGSAQASSPTAVTCGNGAAAVLPTPVSASNSRLYYLDAQGVVRFLTPQGDTGRATNVPAGGQRRSMFTVSPDDQRIAVVVDDYTTSGASTKLYVEDLVGGGNHLDIFSESGAYTLWPIGWHGTSLVVAKVAACAQGGGFGCCGPIELHVVDAATANRRFTIGGPDCIIASSPVPAGAVCETTSGTAKVFDWIDVLQRTYPIPGAGQGPIYLSPDGQHLALSTNASNTTIEGGGTLAMDVCGWIDDTHIFSGGDAQRQPRIGNITSKAVTPVAALGACAGRLPGGLS